jgi:hypothetical protein
MIIGKITKPIRNPTGADWPQTIGLIVGVYPTLILWEIFKNLHFKLRLPPVGSWRTMTAGRVVS